MYAHPATELDLHASLSLLERQFPGLHVGGKTALDWQGVRQYVMQGSALQLYGWAAGRLPEWFAARFPSEYHRKRLFQEEPAALLHVGPGLTHGQRPAVGVAVGRGSAGAQGMNQFYLDTACLLSQVAPLVFKGDTVALKGGTAINLFMRDMLSVVEKDCLERSAKMAVSPSGKLRSAVVRDCQARERVLSPLLADHRIGRGFALFDHGGAQNSGVAFISSVAFISESACS